MKKTLAYILTLFIICQFNTEAAAQLSPGSTAPDWTLTDIDGNSHTLYDMLDDGKTVYLVFSATWCGPCWNFHNSGAFETIWDQYGPNGTDEARTFFIEGDLGTPLSCLYGNCGNTWGDWTAGINFPIINLSASNGPGVAGAYQINYFPTVYAICPDKRVYETGQAPASTLETYMTSCDMMESSIATTEELCFGDGNGSIDLEIQGGISPINYSWSNGSNSQDIQGISAGNYTVTMTDGNNVSYSTSIQLNGPTQALAIEENNSGMVLDCYGGETANISIDPLGGTSPYTALWDDGTTSFDRPDLGAGTYSVTVTDNNGCTNEDNYTVTQPTELQLTLNKLDETCDLANGFISASSNGGTGLHSYNIGQGSSNDPNFPNLAAGVYDVTVTDENSCQTIESIELFNIPGPEAVAPSSLELSCEGAELVIDASSSSITSGANISWSTNDGNIVSGGNTLMPTVDASGTYTLIISDPETCADEAEVLVEPNPEQPIADAGEDQEVNCSNPLVTIGSANSSSGNNITYTWLDDAGNEIGDEQFIEVQQAGTYTLIVTNTDINCSISSEVEVQNVGGSVVAEAEMSGSIDCNQATVILSGTGSSSGDNIVYAWLDGEGNVLGTELELEINEPGTYTLQVTDTIENCTIERTISVPDNRVEPEFNIGGVAELTCETDVITLEGTVSSPDSNYSVSWWNEAGDELSSQLDLEVSSSGTYTLRITNQQTGCESEETVTVLEDKELPTVAIEEPEELSCTVTEVVVDGSASASGSEFTYEWSSNGTVIGSTGPTITVDEPGVYTLTITNTENGCTNTSEIEVIGYDAPPEINTVIIDPASLDITLDADIQGFYDDVLWDFGDGNTANTLEANHTYAHRGTYEICLTLINDCGETQICRTLFVNYGLPGPSAEKKSDSGVAVENPLFGGKEVATRSFMNDNSLQIEIGPNPHEDHIMINWKDYAGESLTLKVTDLNGREFLTRDIKDADVVNRIRLNTIGWNSGMYILHWIGDEEYQSFKLMKQ